MDVSRLRKRDIKAWIPVDEEVKVQCLHLDQQVWDDLKAEATKVTVDDKTGEKTETFDPVKFRHLVGRRVVLAVDGLTDGEDENGPKPFAVTPENIDLLMDRWTEFRLTVTGSPLLLGRMIALEREQLAKNSERTSPRLPTTRRSAARRARTASK